MNASRRGYTTDKDFTLQTCETIVLDENLGSNVRPSVWHLDYIAPEMQDEICSDLHLGSPKALPSSSLELSKRMFACRKIDFSFTSLFGRLNDKRAESQRL